MMLRVTHWENNLLDLAHQALDSGITTRPVRDNYLLHNAYLACEQLTSANSKTFFTASALMPAEKRCATRALYAFCRLSDDMVDCPGAAAGQQSAAERLEKWRRQVLHSSGGSNTSTLEQQVCLAWEETRHKFHIPNGLVEQLLDGLAYDFSRPRYQNFAELARYCYGVACTVGLMSMHITGFSSRAALGFAIRLGVALQLTNILRDVGEDWRAGRLYLPLDELAEFGLDESDIASGVVTERWRAMMRFQIRRARRLYASALPGVSLLHRDGRFAIAAAGELYEAILNKIEANDYDVFSRRASVSGWGKLRRLPGVWWRANVVHYSG